MTTSVGPTQQAIVPADIGIDAHDGTRTGDRKPFTARASFGCGISGAPSIADQYSGLLDDLSPSQRRGLIAKLSVGYCDDWRPTRAQLARHIQNVFGVTAFDVHDEQESISAQNPSGA